MFFLLVLWRYQECLLIGFTLSKSPKDDEKVEKMDGVESMEVDGVPTPKTTTTRSKERIDSISFDCDDDANFLNEMILDY